MNATPVTEADLQAYLDGRLAEGRRTEIEAYLGTRPEEAARLAAYRTQDEALRAAFASVLDEPVPERLTRALRPRRARAYQIAAAFALTLLGGVLGWQLHGALAERAVVPRAVAPLAQHAALAHATYSPEVRHPVEVGADQEAHLVAWLSKRLGAKVRAPDLEAVGYSLMGGRLLPGADSGAGAVTPTAQFMYQSRQGTRVTLYVRTGAQDQNETAFRYAREGKVGVFYWIDRKFGYALSSADIGRDDLLKVANAAYAQLNP
jgi:anti-sigma factor RsiW